MNSVEDAGRFGGMVRLVGPPGMERLKRSRVTVVGMGGVGSWAAEALARSGVGSLRLVDLDDICVTNINRQIHALDGTIGRPKVEAMAERLRAINPVCEVDPVPEFLTERNASEILTPTPTFVVDAIDHVGNKACLLARCLDQGIPVISCGAAGGRLDACQVRIADLAKVTHDRLLAEVRKRLRKLGALPGGAGTCGVPCVYSPVTPVEPEADCRKEAQDSGARLNCDWGYGSAAFVTGTFGFAAAGYVVRRISLPFA